MNQRCLLVIDSLVSGGAQRQISTLALGLRAGGYAVWLYHYFPHLNHFRQVLQDTGVDIIDGRKSWRFSLRPAYELAGLYKTVRPQLVVSFLGTPSVYALLANLVRPATRVVVSERFAFSDIRSTLGERMRYSLYRRAAWISVNSHHHAAALAKRYPSLTPKMRVIYNGIDMDVFQPSNDIEAARDDSKFLVIGTLHPRKNARALIEAMYILRSRGVQINIQWLGNTDEDETVAKEYRRCQQQLHAHKLEGQWQWLGETQDVVPYLQKSTALLHPSRLEGLPNAICEALACGTPVLAADVGDNAQLIGNDERGLLFDPESDQSIADAIESYVNAAKATGKAMAFASRDYALSTLSIGRYVDDYLSLLPVSDRP